VGLASAELTLLIVAPRSSFASVGRTVVPTMIQRIASTVPVAHRHIQPHQILVPPSYNLQALHRLRNHTLN
jgi:hypothetical protein